MHRLTYGHVRVYVPRSIALAAPAGHLPDLWLCSLFSVGAVVSYTALLTVLESCQSRLLSTQ